MVALEDGKTFNNTTCTYIEANVRIQTKNDQFIKEDELDSMKLHKKQSKN